MIVAGKCPPEKDELESTEERGFEDIELYLEKKHLDNMDITLKNLRDSDLTVVSVHTPHVSLEEKEYFLKADRLASKLDAYLVFHSQYLHHVHIPRIEEELSLSANYGYENNPGVSKHHLENLILDQGHELVIDTAHLYMAEENFQERFAQLLETHSDKISRIHLCDSTKTEDGLGFGDGEMNMEHVCQAISNSGFDGIVVLEVMPDKQESALEKWQDYTS